MNEPPITEIYVIAIPVKKDSKAKYFRNENVVDVFYLINNKTPVKRVYDNSSSCNAISLQNKNIVWFCPGRNCGIVNFWDQISGF